MSGVRGIQHVEAGRVLAASTLEIVTLASIESIRALGAFFASSTSLRNDCNSSIIPLSMSTTGRLLVALSLGILSKSIADPRYSLY